jgi:hypothetical protein
MTGLLLLELVLAMMVMIPVIAYGGKNFLQDQEESAGRTPTTVNT